MITAPALFWLLVVLIQGQGMQVGVYGTEEECQVDAKRAAVDPIILGHSACFSVIVKGKS